MPVPVVSENLESQEGGAVKRKEIHLLQRENLLCLQTLPNRKKISSTVFLICFWLYLVIRFAKDSMLSQTDPDLYHWILGFSLYLAGISLINILLLTDYSVGEMILILAACAAAWISCRHHGEQAVLVLTAILFSGRHADWGKFLRRSAVLIAAGIVLLAVLYFLGPLDSGMRFYRPVTMQPRLALGFIHPNGVGSFILSLTCLYVMIRLERWRWWDYALVAAAAIFCQIVPNSRTSVILLAVLIPGIFLFRFFHGAAARHVVLRVLLCLVYPACAAVSVWLGVFCRQGTAFYLLADRLLSLRISDARYFAEHYHVTLWGQKLVTKPKAPVNVPYIGVVNRLILDNSYLHVLYQDGLIIFLILMVWFTFMLWEMLRRGRDSAALVLILMAVEFVMEHQLTKLPANAALFAVPLLVSDAWPSLPQKRGNGAGRSSACEQPLDDPLRKPDRLPDMR